MPFIKSLIKKIVLFALLMITTVFASNVEDEKKLIEVLERQECKHCHDLKDFFEDLSSTRDDFTVNYYEIKEEGNINTWDSITSLEGVSKSTPILIIGGQLIQGFDSAETTGLAIQDMLDTATVGQNLSFREYLEKDVHSSIQKLGSGCTQESCGIERSYTPFYVKVPFLKPFDVKKYSLPVMSFVLGMVDGFNPCAMWVLVTFILILAKIGDTKKLIQVVGLFLIAQAIMYALILNVWIGVWDFVGLDAIITPIIGLVALGAGLFFLWEYKQEDAGCKVTNSEQRKKTKSKIEKIVTSKMSLITAIAIISIALSVNVINFACSIGIPQVFTKVLELNGIEFWGRQYYVALYILAFLLDDLTVFAISLYSLKKLGFTAKYSKASNLIGGIIMLALGLIMIFKPELLVFI